MFKCGICGKNSYSGETAVRVVLAYRKRTYINKNVDKETGKPYTKISEGTEVVKEVLAHERCAK